jgi:acetyl esterase/lipase
MRSSCLRLALIALALTSGGAAAQLPPQTADKVGPSPATPLGWKWERFKDRNVYFHWVEKRGRPLVLMVPAAPGDGYTGFGSHLARYLHDQGYALGVIDWRGDRARKQLPSQTVSQIVDEIAQVRALGAERGSFDPSTIVLLGSGEGAFLAALLAADRQLITNAGSSPLRVCATLLLHPANLDPLLPDTYIARRQFAREPGAAARYSPLSRAASAPPTLLITDATDRREAARAQRALMALRPAGRTAVHETLPHFEFDDERTYLGHASNRATRAMGSFLKTHCPAE